MCSMKQCQSCGDYFNPEKRLQRLERDGLKPASRELDYCFTCANELFRNTIRIQNVNTHASGLGCPLEGGHSEDPSPWEENAIRELEDSL